MTEQRYGVMSPDMIAGVREDFPHIRLDQAFHADSENVHIRNGEVHRFRGRLKELLDGSDDQVQTPDTYPVIKYHLHVNKNNELSLFGATKAHIYLWSESAGEWQLRHTCASDCDHWIIVSWNQGVVATNNVDKVLWWSDSTTGTNFAALGSTSGLDLDGGTTYLTAAKYAFVFENRIYLGFTTEGGEVYPFRVRWCSLGDGTDWNEESDGDSGAKDFIGGDHLMGFGTYGNTIKYLIVFLNNSIQRGWQVVGDAVHNWAGIAANIGLLATDSIVYDRRDDLYFLASDYSIRELQKGRVSDAVDKTVRNINPSLEELSAGTFIEEYGLCAWSIPEGDSATGNNRTLMYHPERKIWSKHSWEIRAFGNWQRQTVWTIDTWPYTSIDGISQETIDSVENVAGFPLDLGSDYSGYTWTLHQAETDKGSSYYGTLILATDMAGGSALPYDKRVSEVELYFRSQGTGEVEVHVKRDDEAAWQSVGSADLTGTAEFIRVPLYLDKAAKSFLWRLRGTSMFRFVGAVFTFEPDGDD